MTTQEQFPQDLVALSLPRVFTTKDGRGCIVRTMVVNDATKLCNLLPQTHTESDFLNFMPGEFKLTIEQEEEFIRERTGKPDCLLLLVEIDGTIVGLGGAWSPEFRRFAHHAELGLTVVKDYWGLGIGRQLMEIILDWACARKLHKIYLKVFANNERAMALYLSMGFTEEARLKDDCRKADGGFTDAVVMSKFIEAKKNTGE